ncbi:MAG TPA: LytTR family DNA-binding domain-containing protein [Gemmatimonadaceae bacterium]|nr:LytTR family DNA-binding domain-containing protein [Gemmatimonadaceae bacterium]
MRLLLVDDEAPARAKMRRALQGLPNLTIVGEAASGAEAVDRIRELAPDVVLLDVQMPGKTGFDVIAEIGVEAMPVVVFVTAYDDHAVQAFEVRAFDYVLKPYAPDRLRMAVNRARERVGAESDSSVERLRSLVEEARPVSRHLTRLMVHDDRQATLLPVEEIVRAEAARNDVRLHTRRGTFRLRGRISELAERLDPAAFLRINRSEIVRLDAIRALHPWSHGDVRVEMTDGAMLTWSRRYRAQSRGDFELG